MTTPDRVPNRVRRGDHDPVSIGLIVRDTLVSLLFLIGALVIEALKRLFGPTGPPLVVNGILTLSEITLGLSFLVSLIRALRSVFVEVSHLFAQIGQSGFWRAIKSANLEGFTREETKKAIGYGVAGGFTITIFLVFVFVVAVFLQGLPIVFLWVVAAVVVAILLVLIIEAARTAGVFGLATSELVGCGVLLIIPLVLLAFSIALILVLRLAGRSDILNKFLDAILL
jgi:hypothetical protein